MCDCLPTPIATPAAVTTTPMKTSLFTSLRRSAWLLGATATILTAQAQPTIHSVYPNGTVQLQATNQFSFGATSSGPDLNTTGISVQLTSQNLLGQIQVTNLTSANGLTIGGTVTERTVTAPIKTNILAYTAVIIVTDANGGSTTNTVNFDTLSPAFTIEAEDFNYYDSVNSISGAYVDFNAWTPGAYAILSGIEGVDAHDNNLAEGQFAYRPDGMQNETTGDKPRQVFVDANFPDYNVGWTGGGEWGNYTRTFPAGVYNVYIRAARGNGGNAGATMSLVTSDPAQPNQTTTALGNFVVPSTGNWQTYGWAPLTDNGGAVQKVTLSGTQTIRFTTLDGYNVNYYAFFLANTNLPTIHDVYPDGARLLQPATTMTFIVSSVSGINPSGISVDLFSTNLLGGVLVTNYTSANGLTIGGTANDRTVSLPLQTNILFYRAVISATDTADNNVSVTVNFDTLNPSFVIEAEDFDYNNGQFFDNPQTNAYAGTEGIQGVDAFHNVTPPNGPPNGPYRTGGYNNENTGDKARDKYIGTGFSDYNLGWNEGGFWANYTRTYPAGTYNVFIRAGNGTGGNGTATFGQVTSGVGTPTQTVTNYGTFSIPQTGGWQTYTWVPLKDTGGNLVQVSGGAVKTFRVTAGGGYNPNFYAFFPADTSLPIIDQISPDGTAAFQYTNTFRFRASSTAGIAQGNVTLTINGTPVTGLQFSGSTTSWNVTYTNLPVNNVNTVTISVQANNGATKSTTVTFDTFKASYYQLEAEDYDYNGGQFIDNPAANAYAGLAAVADVDFHDVATGGGYSYRPTGTATEGITDFPRAQFIGFTEYNIGFFENGEWGNYTRNYPVGTYHVWLRSATGNGANTTATLEKVTSGQGTTTQTTAPVGTFAIANNGWGSYGWAQLKDVSNQPAVVVIDGFPNTLRFGRPVATPGANVNFLMLVPVLAPTQLKVARAGNTTSITLPAQTGFSYQVQYKNNLTDPTWNNLGSVVTGNNTVQTVNDTTTQASRFYRAIISQP